MASDWSLLWADIRAVVAFYLLMLAIKVSPDDGQKARLIIAVNDFCCAEQIRIGAKDG